jgi:hypothetical protein
MRNIPLTLVATLALWSFALNATAAAYCPPSLEDALEDVPPGGTLLLPRGHVFQPLIADPIEPHFFLSYRSYRKDGETVNTGVIGAGETFPLWRRVGGCSTDGMQLDVNGGGVARFVLDDGRNDLIDGDFTVAVPLSWRQGTWSWRARLYHNSSHLGEDYLYQNQTPPRSKASYESIDFIVGYDQPEWRLYFGPEVILRHYPSFEPWGLHVGAEYYGDRTLFGGLGRWIGGLDVKSWGEYGYAPDYSLKAGLSLGGSRRQQQHLQLLLELYTGHQNRGVFYDDKVQSIGAGVYFGF